MRDHEEAQAEASHLRVAAEHLRKAADALARHSSVVASPANSNAMDRAPSIDERATTKQVGAAFGIARKRGMSRDRLLALVSERTGKDRIEYLTRREASDLIDELGARGA